MKDSAYLEVLHFVLNPIPRGFYSIVATCRTGKCGGRKNIVRTTAHEISEQDHAYVIRADERMLRRCSSFNIDYWRMVQ